MSRVLAACAALAAGLVADQALGEGFSWELAGLASESDRASPVGTDIASVQATYFFDAVDDASGPYALASFFHPATRISATLSEERFKTDELVLGPPANLTIPATLSITDHYSVGGRYLLRPSRWYFGGSYTESDIDERPPTTSFGEDLEAYGVLVGKYLGAATTLEVTFDSSEFRSESEYDVCVIGQICLNAGTRTRELRRDRTSLGVLHVRRFRSLTYALSGRIANSDGEFTEHTPSFMLPLFGPSAGLVATIPASTSEQSIPRLRNYSVGGALYPTPRIGVHVGYTRWDDDTPADRAYDVSASWYVTRNVALELALSRQKAEPANGAVFTDADFTNLDTTAVRVSGRF